MSSTRTLKPTLRAGGKSERWRSHFMRRAWLGAVGSLLLGGCLVDLDNRCGSHQKYNGDAIRCECAEGFGLVGTKCIACGENEVGSLSGCACAPGYLRASSEAPCAAQDTLGRACTKDEDCVHPDYNYCHLGDTGGYCTSAGCTSSKECPNSISYACNTRESPSFCERPPTGFGAQCSSDEQCAGFEASYCESASSKACLVNDCKADPDICYGDQVCCDIGLIGTSICIPPDQLANGACPAGGTLIKGGG
jgi:hypothetical protein